MQMGNDIENHEKHAMHTLALAEILRPELSGPRNTAALDRLEHERSHLRHALDYFLEHGDGERVERLIGALRDFWWRQKHFQEAQEWIATVLAMPWLLAATRAAVLDHAGGLAYGQQDYPAAFRYFTESLAIRRETGPSESIAQSLIHLAVIVRWGQDDATAARTLYEEALVNARAADSSVLIAAALMPLGTLALESGDVETAQALLSEGMTRYIELDMTMAFPLALEQFAALAAVQGRHRRALCLASGGARQRELLAALPTPYAAWVERFMAPARHALGEAAADAVWAEGQAMTLKQAIALARADDHQ